MVMGIVVAVVVCGVQNVFVDGHVNRVRMGNRHFDALYNVHGVQFLDLDRVRLLDGVRDSLLDDLRNDFVDRHMDRLLDGHVHWVRLRAAGREETISADELEPGKPRRSAYTLTLT